MGYLIAETRMDFSDEGPRQGRRRKLRVGPEIRKHLESLDCQVKKSSYSAGRWVRSLFQDVTGLWKGLGYTR